MGIPLRVLIVEDSEDDTTLVLRVLRRGGYDPTSERVDTAETMCAALEERAWDIVISDYTMPRFSARAALAIVREREPDLPFIIVSGTIGEATAVEAMKAGAHDYLMKNNLPRLVPAVERELREAEVRRERRRAEEALRQEHDLLDRIMETSPAGITMVDRGGMITFANAQAERVLGLSKDEITQRTYNSPAWKITDYEGNPFPDEYLPFRRVMTTGQPVYDVRYAIEWPDGKRVLLSVNAAPLLDESGQVDGMVSTIEDITEQVHAERRLRESERRFREMLEGIRLVGVMLDIEGNITFCNDFLLELTGWQREELIGKNWFDVFLPSDARERARTTHLERVSTGSPEIHYENEILTRANEQRTILWNNTILRDHRGEIVGTASIGEDISERKAMEEQLIHINRLFSVLSSINRMIVRTRDRQRLFDEACHIVVEEGLFRMAWIGIVDEESGSVKPVACNGFEEGYLDGIVILLGDALESRGPTGKAIQTGKHVICNDIEHDPSMIPWREKALERGYRSSGVFPLRMGGKVVGVLSAYAEERDYFSEEEILLLDQLADDLSFAVNYIELEAQRREAELALSESEERFRSVAESASDAIISVDDAGKIIFWNTAAEKVFGYSAEETLGRSPTFIIPERFREAHHRASMRALSTGESSISGRIVEMFGIKKDGSEFPLELSVAGWGTKEGRFFTGVIRDITERKRTHNLLMRRLEFEKIAATMSSRFVGVSDMDAAIHASLADMGGFSGASRCSVFLLSGDGTVLSNTHEWCDEGVAGERENSQNIPVETRPWLMERLRNREIIHVFDVTELPEEARAEREILEARGVKSFLVQPLQIGGKLNGFLALGDVVETGAWRDDDLGILRMASEIIGNALERKRAEEEVRRIASDLRQLIDTANAPIIGINTEGLVNEWNQMAERITGYTKAEVLGRHFVKELLAQDKRAAVGAVLTKALDGQGTENFEVPFETKDSRRVTILLNATPRRDAEGHIVGVIGVGQDITELSEYRENLEHRVEERTRELAESLKREKALTKELQVSLQKEKELATMKTRFVSMASHEFRTPLSAILSSTDILARYSDRMTPEQQAERFMKIRQQVHNMTMLLDEVLIIGRADAGRLEFHPMPVDLQAFCREIVQEIRDTEGAGHIIRFTDTISSPDATFLLDEKLARHIVANLLSNAVKYSSKGSTVFVDLTCDEHQATLRVQDQGIGIPEEDLPHLFEPFHRASNVGDTHGTGLGLAILQRAVDLHRGRVAVESEVGRGTTFTVVLPRQKEQNS